MGQPKEDDMKRYTFKLSLHMDFDPKDGKIFEEEVLTWLNTLSKKLGKPVKMTDLSLTLSPSEYTATKDGTGWQTNNQDDTD